jgi:hypothetical protein
MEYKDFNHPYIMRIATTLLMSGLTLVSSGLVLTELGRSAAKASSISLEPAGAIIAVVSGLILGLSEFMLLRSMYGGVYKATLYVDNSTRLMLAPLRAIVRVLTGVLHSWYGEVVAALLFVIVNDLLFAVDTHYVLDGLVEIRLRKPVGMLIWLQTGLAVVEFLLLYLIRIWYGKAIALEIIHRDKVVGREHHTEAYVRERSA